MICRVRLLVPISIVASVPARCRRLVGLVASCCLALSVVACRPEDATDDEVSVDFPLPLPPGLPPPRVPMENPLTAEAIELGRHLFFDVRLSGNGTQSCATCHEPARAFTDGKARPIGSTGDVLPRNSMSLVNVAWMSTLTWANPQLATLEQQALVPMFADHPVELGMADRLDEILERLRSDSLYPSLFAAAFSEVDDPITDRHIVMAVASFQRSLISADSPYDRYVYGGDRTALSDEQKLGLQVFNSEVAECYHCHGGVLFTNAFVAADSTVTEPAFENTGLYNIDGDGGYPEPNTGLFAFSGAPRDMGRFRVPTLRNLRYSAPYFHDGSAATLDEVLDHYLAGGRTVTGQHAGVGSDSPLKNPLVRPFTLTAQERAALLSFLRDGLADESMTTHPAFQSPFPR
jgi:cytochrome c peroxidase